MEKNKVLIVDDISENIETISEMIKDYAPGSSGYRQRDCHKENQGLPASLLWTLAIIAATNGS